MDLQDLPRFPGQHDQRFPEKNEPTPARGEILCTLFDFGTGLALANVAFMLLLAACSDAPFWVAVEAALVFGVFGLLVVLSRLSPVIVAAEVAYDEGHSPRGWAGLAGVGIVLAAVVGVGLGVGAAWIVSGCFGALEAAGRPVKAPGDNLMAAALGGALVGMLGGGSLFLAGGTPENIGKLFCFLGRLLPWLLRKCLFRKRGTDVQIPARPQLEGVIWLGLVVGGVGWLLWW
jgi:hypothetical protein